MVTAAVLSACSIEYRKDVLYPVLQAVARKAGQADLYDGMISNTEPLVIPTGVSEMEIKRLQVLSHNDFTYLKKGLLDYLFSSIFMIILFF